MRPTVLWPELQGPTNKLQRRREIPSLTLDQAQQMLRPEVIWCLSENRVAPAFGLCQLPLLMEQYSVLKGKGPSGNKRAILRTGIRRDGVVPFAMERGTFDVEGGHLAVGHDNAAGV